MTEAVFQRAALPGLPCLFRRLPNALTIIRVNLLERIGAYQFLGGIAKHPLIRGAVVKRRPLTSTTAIMSAACSRISRKSMSSSHHSRCSPSLRTCW